MIIIGADYHPTFQQIAFVDTETGELQERRLDHPEAAEKFYRELAAPGKKVRVGMEASGHARWFERLLAELNLNCGLATPPRSTGSANASRRPIARTHNIFCTCC